MEPPFPSGCRTWVFFFWFMWSCLGVLCSPWRVPGPPRSMKFFAHPAKTEKNTNRDGLSGVHPKSEPDLNRRGSVGTPDLTQPMAIPITPCHCHCPHTHDGPINEITGHKKKNKKTKKVGHSLYKWAHQKKLSSGLTSQEVYSSRLHQMLMLWASR